MTDGGSLEAMSEERFHDPRYCPTCGTDGPGRRRSAEDLSLCDDPWHDTHPRRWGEPLDGVEHG
jgi:hypothetical protein